MTDLPLQTDVLVIGAGNAAFAAAHAAREHGCRVTVLERAPSALLTAASTTLSL